MLQYSNKLERNSDEQQNFNQDLLKKQQQQIPNKFLCEFSSKGQSMLIGNQYVGQMGNNFKYVQGFLKDFKLVQQNNSTQIPFQHYSTLISQSSQRNQNYKGTSKKKLLEQIKKFFDRQYEFSILFLQGHGSLIDNATYFCWFQQKSPLPHLISFQDIASLWQISKIRYLLIICCFCHSGQWQQKMLKLPQQYSISMVTSCEKDDITRLHQARRLFRFDNNVTLQGNVIYFVARLCQQYFKVNYGASYKSNVDMKQILSIQKLPVIQTTMKNNVLPQLFRQANAETNDLQTLKYYIKDQKINSQVKSIYSGWNRTSQNNNGGLFHKRQFQGNKQFFYEGGFTGRTFDGHGRYSFKDNTNLLHSKYSQYSKDNNQIGELKDKQTKQLYKIYNSKVQGEFLATVDQYSNKNRQSWQFNQNVKWNTQRSSKRQYKGLQLIFYLHRKSYFLQVNFYPQQDRQRNKKNLISMSIKQFKLNCCSLNINHKVLRNFKRQDNEQQYKEKKQINQLKYRLTIRYQQNGTITLFYKAQEQFDWNIGIHKEFSKNNCLSRFLIPGYIYEFQVYKKISVFQITRINYSVMLINRLGLALAIVKDFPYKFGPDNKQERTKAAQLSQKKLLQKIVPDKQSKKHYILQKGYQQSFLLIKEQDNQIQQIQNFFKLLKG